MHSRRAAATVLETAAAVAVAATAVLLPSSAAAAPADPPDPSAIAAPPADGAPRCGADSGPGGGADGGFPVASRLRDGPSGYPAGLLASPFALDLRDTTDGPCTDVHPLIVLADQDGALSPRSFRLWYAPPGGGWQRVPVETTRHGEAIGIPGGPDGPGLTLPPGRTVTVRLRLWFAPDAPAERVVASATTMQRRGADGSWVAESNHYVFDVVPPVVAGGEAGDGAVPGAGPALADTGTGARRTAFLWQAGVLAGGLLLAGTALVAAGRWQRGTSKRPAVRRHSGR